MNRRMEMLFNALLALALSGGEWLVTRFGLFICGTHLGGSVCPRAALDSEKYLQLPSAKLLTCFSTLSNSSMMESMTVDARYVSCGLV